jgi:hypothetical protein
VGYPESLCGKEGDPISWVVKVEGKESWWIGIVGVRNLGIGMCEDNVHHESQTSLWVHSPTMGVACC